MYELVQALLLASPLERANWTAHAGLKNLGNTCYINSGIQVFMHLPELTKVASRILITASNVAPLLPPSFPPAFTFFTSTLQMLPLFCPLPSRLHSHSSHQPSKGWRFLPPSFPPAFTFFTSTYANARGATRGVQEDKFNEVTHALQQVVMATQRVYEPFRLACQEEDVSELMDVIINNVYTDLASIGISGLDNPAIINFRLVTKGSNPVSGVQEVDPGWKHTLSIPDNNNQVLIEYTVQIG